MKENNTVKLGYRPADVVTALGSKAIYLACLKAGWLAPVIDRHKLRLFTLEDVTACYHRLRAGESPFKTASAKEASNEQAI
jgi:hypothetical protein